MRTNLNSSFVYEYADPGPEETLKRRAFTYSRAALQVATALDKRLVIHPRFKEALEALDRAFQLAGVLSVGQGVVVAGHGGMGRSELARYFIRTLPSNSLVDRTSSALLIELGKHPTGGSVLESLLGAVKYPFPRVTGERVRQKAEILSSALQQRQTKMLFVDRAEHLLLQRTMSRSDKAGTSATATLISLMDSVPLSLVLLGDVSSEELNRLDEGLGRRMNARVRLDRFEPTVQWHAFVRAFVALSDTIDLGILDNAEQVQRLHQITSGSLDRFKHLVLEAVMVAEDAGVRAVELPHLRTAFGRVFRGAHDANPYDHA